MITPGEVERVRQQLAIVNEVRAVVGRAQFEDEPLMRSLQMRLFSLAMLTFWFLLTERYEWLCWKRFRATGDCRHVCGNATFRVMPTGRPVTLFVPEAGCPVHDPESWIGRVLARLCQPPEQRGNEAAHWPEEVT